MQARRFSRMVESVVLGVASSAATGCGGIDTEGIEPLACASSGQQVIGGDPDWAGAVRPEVEFDAVELRSVQPGALAGGSRLDQVSNPVAERGRLCSGATDEDACAAAVTSVAFDSGGFRFGDCLEDCLVYYLVATRGDEAFVLDSASEVRAWLGNIDTPTEAAWMARVTGFDIGCDAAPGVRSGDEHWGVRETRDGYEVLAIRQISMCEPYEAEMVLLAVAPGGAVEELDSETFVDESNMCAVAGRRPVGFRARPPRRGHAVGRHLARMAELEAASVDAFAHLAAELAHHRAPRRLVAAARRARADEVRHARATRALAGHRGRAHDGGAATGPRRGAATLRDREAIATDNAREGCVREALGAVIARWQSLHARDPVVRATMRRIAREEAQHAEFSFRLDAWLRPLLDPAARSRLACIEREAVAELHRELAQPVDAELIEELGLPSAHTARALLDGLMAARARSEG